MTPIICGVDVCSAALDAAIRGPAGDGAAARFANDAAGIAALLAFCQGQGVGLVVMEATGGYERLAFGTLWGGGMAVAVVNPRMVRRFAEAIGRFEKTDRIDARLIAWFAEVKRIRPTPPVPAAQARLAALVTRLRQPTEDRVAERNRRRLVTDPDVLRSFSETIALLSRQLRDLEAEVGRLIAADPLWARLDAAFREIKGVANRTVARLMAELPEIGTLHAKPAAKLTGLAPIARDSGKAQHRRPIRGGRASVRSILVIVAEIVRRHDPDFRAHHAKLTAAGKPKMVVRVALAHKLLTRLNAKARDARAALP